MVRRPSYLQTVVLGAVLTVLSVILGSSTGALAQGPVAQSPDISLVALSPGFNYQGVLATGGVLVNNTCDIQVGLWDAASQGNQVGNTQTIANIPVANGQFTVMLNGGNEFGNAAFNGDARWLELAVRCAAGSGSYSTLSPRQAITAVPYALYALDAPGAGEHDHFGESWAGSAERGLQVINSDSGDFVYGVFGESSAASGRGVGGFASTTSGTAAGVEGETLSTNGQGVFGNALATSGYNVGVLGTTDSISGTGVSGIANAVSGETIGVRGESRSPNGTGVIGINTSSISNVHAIGIAGFAESPSGRGVYGEAFANSGQAFGVTGVTRSEDGRGVFGWATDTSGNNFGVFGESESSNGVGVLGVASGTSGNAVGVVAVSDSTNGRGIYASADATSGDAIGIYAITNSPDGYAGYFDGRVHVDGTLTKNAGAFKIDHPLDPENKYLQHSFVESPDMMNVYNGNDILDENGEATVQLPDWFEALNQDFRYQLTSIGAPGPGLYIAEEISGNAFQIAGGEPGAKVSWQVTGVRHDPYAEAHRIVVEEDKPLAEKGTYLHPVEWGQPQELGLNYQRWQLSDIEEGR